MLPINTRPTYTCNIPSTNMAYKYQPFTVGDEKALMIAQQSENPQVIVESLKQLIIKCAVNEVQVDNLTTFDLEFLFLKLRTVSVGEIIELQPTHCDKTHTVSLDLNNVDVTKTEDLSDNIKLFGECGVKMKYPSLDSATASFDETDVTAIFELICSCIDYIYDGDEIYYASDQTKEELREFVEGLTQQQFQGISQYLENIPRLEHTLNWQCEVCGETQELVLQGLASFFQ